MTNNSCYILSNILSTQIDALYFRLAVSMSFLFSPEAEFLSYSIKLLYTVDNNLGKSVGLTTTIGLSVHLSLNRRGSSQQKYPYAEPVTCKPAQSVLARC